VSAEITAAACDQNSQSFEFGVSSFEFNIASLEFLAKVCVANSKT
jgi:hypothetical protein